MMSHWMKMDTKAISYVYVIIGLVFIVAGVVIGLLANMGLFEQTISSDVLPCLIRMLWVQ